jgi:hypothetical protein
MARPMRCAAPVTSAARGMAAGIVIAIGISRVTLVQRLRQGNRNGLSLRDPTGRRWPTRSG